MSELRTNRIVPRDGLPSGSAGGNNGTQNIPESVITLMEVSA